MQFSKLIIRKFDGGNYTHRFVEEPNMEWKSNVNESNDFLGVFIAGDFK